MGNRCSWCSRDEKQTRYRQKQCGGGNTQGRLSPSHPAGNQGQSDGELSGVGGGEGAGPRTRTYCDPVGSVCGRTMQRGIGISLSCRAAHERHSEAQLAPEKASPLSTLMLAVPLTRLPTLHSRSRGSNGSRNECGPVARTRGWLPTRIVL